MRKKYLILIIILILLLIIGFILLFNINNRTYFKYSDFNSKLKKGDIQSAIINEDSIYFSIKNNSR